MGPPVGLERLRNLAHSLVGDPRDPAAGYLSQALSAALSTRPERLQLLTWEGNRGVSLQFSGGQEKFQELQQCPFDRSEPQTCLLLQRRGWFFRQAPEWEFLRKHCGVGPIGLMINGEPLVTEWGLRRQLTAHKMYWPTQYVAVSYHGASKKITCERSYHVLEDREPAQLGDDLNDLIVLPRRPASPILGSSTGWALLQGRERLALGDLVRSAVGIRADLRAVARLQMVRHGVLLKPISVPHEHPGLEILASSAGLQVDLSGSALVDNEELKTRCQELLSRGQAMWKKFLRHHDRNPSGCVATELSGDPQAIHGYI
jgi:hypothetical protein